MPDKKLYIGCKLIKAYHMSKREHEANLGKEWDGTEENEKGYCVEYPDGYTSWSPKKVFEEVYRLVSIKELDMF